MEAARPLRLDERRCCHAGCENVATIGNLQSGGWYKCSIGFMQWACPEHAHVWRDYCRRISDHEAAISKAYSDALAKFENELEQRIAAEYPEPASLPSQPSV